MNKTAKLLCLASLAVTFALPSFGANITKASTGTDLTVGANWSGGTAPATNDVALWDTGSLGTGLTLNSGTPVWSGIKVNAGATDPINIGSGGTLTLGPDGIDMSASTINATISSGLTLGSGYQLWNVPTGRTLALNTGTFTRGGGASINIQGSGTVSSSMTGLANDAGGILNWIINGSGSTAAFSTLSGGNIIGYSGATSVSTTGGAWCGIPSGDNHTVNYKITGGSFAATGVARSVNSLIYTLSGAGTQIANNSFDGMTNNAIMNVGGGTFTIGGGSFALNIRIGINNELLLGAMNSDIVVSNAVKDNGSGAAGSVTILGGTGRAVTFFGANAFSGDLNVDSGTLIANRGNNSLNPATSALGNPQLTRNIVVNNGGTLRLIQGDTLGGANSAIVSTLVVNRGGIVTNNNNNFNTFGPVQLNGGTITGAGGAVAGYQMYNLRGNVTVGGSSMSTLAGTGAFSGYHLAAPTTFDVGNVTAGTDLLVSAALVDRNQTDGGPGLLTKIGNGTMTLTGTNTYTGATFINVGTLALSGNGSIGNSLMISIASGATFDVSGLSSTFTLGTGQWISNSVGTINGSVNLAGAGASISPDMVGVPGTLTFNNNLNMSAGGAAYFDLSTSASSGNDQILVGGNLTLTSSDSIHINAFGGSLQAADYVLFSVTTGSTMASIPILIWDVAPANYLNYSLQKVGNNIVLHYSSSTAPSVTASVNPGSVARNQPVTVTANVTQGSGSIASVTVDLTSIGGSATANLVQDSSQLPSLVYTNTFVVAGSTALGDKNPTVTVTDDTTPTPLTGNYIITGFTISANSVTWNGGGSNDKWTTNPDWIGNVGPGYIGDAVTFAGTTRLTPDMDTNFSVTSVTFDGTAGSFTLGTSSSTLTNSGGIVNNSTAPQIVNLPIVMTAAQSFNPASGNLTFNSNIVNGGFTLTAGGTSNMVVSAPISGGGGLTKVGNGTLTLTATNTFSGSLFVKGGTNVLDSGAINTGGSFCSIGQDGSDIGTFILKGTATFTNTADFNVGDIGSSVGVLNIQDSAVLTCARLFVASANAAGSTAQGTVNQTGGVLVETDPGIGFFAIGGRISASGVGVYNMSGGTLTSAAGIRVGSSGTGTMNISGSAVVNANGGFNIARITNSTGTLNLDGGTVTTLNITSSTGTNATNNLNGATVKPTSANVWISNLTQCNVRNGGAILDTAGFNVSVPQALQHSVITGDNATDGGLTKLGNGTLYLNGTNTYTGPTVVNGGTLGGSGIIGSAVTANNGGGIAPGNAGIGTLTINGNLTLNAGSTNVFEVNGTTPTNDLVVAGGTVAYGGVLSIVTNGTFTAGQTFTLFSGTGAANTSNFSSILGTPGTGLSFKFTNGVLSVVSGIAMNPTNITFTVSGNTLGLSWPSDHLGWILQAQTNTLSAGLGTNWVDVAGSGGITSTNLTVNPANPTVFFRLRSP